MFERLGATFMTLWALIVYALMARAAGQYDQIFEAIPQIPLLTQILLIGPIYWTVAAISVVSYALYWFGVPYTRMAQAICAISTFVMLPLFVFAMHLPMNLVVKQAGQ